jgi:uncharacterized protein YjbI with pentapeptide repeats
MPGTPPPRPGDDIPIVNATPFTIATRPWQFRPGRDALVVIVKGSFDLVDDAPATAREESDYSTGQMHVDDDPAKSCISPFDFALLKPRPEVMVVGHAHARGGRASAGKVVFRFGSGAQRIDKTVLVQGDRRWQTGLAGAHPSEPEPFTSIPLIYERAFGGPEHALNPWGTGHGRSTVLPNLELPGRLVMHPNDTPPPACFAPLALEHGERWAKLGTYDRRWFKERWPYFAEDFDYAFFQDAPLDQRLDAIVGNEPFSAEGVHPELGEIRGSLPGERARVFAYERPGGELVPIGLRLDTVLFDFDARCVHLVWRGSIDVAAPDAPEIQLLFLTREPTSAEITVATAQAQFEATLAARATDRDAAPAEPEEDLHDAEREVVEDVADPREAQMEAELRQRMATLGIDETAAQKPPAAPIDPAALAASMRKGGASEEQIAELAAAIAAAQEPAPESVEAPAPDPERLRQLVIAARAAGESLAGRELDGADLSDLDLRGCDLSRAQLREARLSRAQLDGASLVGAQLGAAVLDDAVLTGADLSEADFAGARLEGARLDRAIMNATSFEGVTADRATVTGARGERTNFTDGSWERAHFEEAVLTAADFTRARLGKARFTRAELPKVRLYDARMRESNFDGATMPNTRAEGADLQGASFVGASAESSVFEGAQLDHAVLKGAALQGSSFVRSVARKADFSQVDLRQGRLARADLRGSSFSRANLMSADLEAADLTIADLRGANLHAANLWRALLADAKLAGAIITKSSLIMRQS